MCVTSESTRETNTGWSVTVCRGFAKPAWRTTRWCSRRHCLSDCTVAAGKYGKENITISDGAFVALREYNYPGNIRELKNIFERAVLLAEDGVIRLGHLPQKLRGQVNEGAVGFEALSLEEGVRHYERGRIIAALEETGGKRQHAADTLKITRKVLWKKMKDYDIAS